MPGERCPSPIRAGERERLTAEQAFDVLRRASQHLNIKLREVAERVTVTGERPPTPA